MQQTKNDVFHMKLPFHRPDPDLIRRINATIKVSDESLSCENKIVSRAEMDDFVMKLILKHGDNEPFIQLLKKIKMLPNSEVAFRVQNGVYKMLLLASRKLPNHQDSYHIVILDYRMSLSVESDNALFTNWNNIKLYMVYRLLNNVNHKKHDGFLLEYE